MGSESMRHQLKVRFVKTWFAGLNAFEILLLQFGFIGKLHNVLDFDVLIEIVECLQRLEKLTYIASIANLEELVPQFAD